MKSVASYNELVKLSLAGLLRSNELHWYYVHLNIAQEDQVITTF